VADAQALGDLIDRVHRFPRPVVSALEGDAVGSGAALALAADLVVMGESARIGFPEVTRGLVAALAVPDLVRQVGDRRARELLLTGRLVGSESALAWGLVNRVVASEGVLAESVRLAEEAALGGPMALATTKHLLDESTQRPKTLRGAAAISAAVSDSDEAREGVEAAQGDRPPGWQTGAMRVRSPDDGRDGGIDPDLPETRGGQ
jgi:methylglutaconyl-CoA hydratase